jgi:hypothetical protein
VVALATSRRRLELADRLAEQTTQATYCLANLAGGKLGVAARRLSSRSSGKQPRDRLKPGGSCRAAIRTAGAPFCDGVIALEGTVHRRASNLKHQMRATWRPTHLLLGVHPAVQQPLHRAFGDRRRDWLLAPPGRRVIDDDIGMPVYLCFEFTQKTRHSQRRRRFGRGFKRRHGFCDEVETAPDLSMP